MDGDNVLPVGPEEGEDSCVRGEASHAPIANGRTEKSEEAEGGEKWDEKAEAWEKPIPIDDALAPPAFPIDDVFKGELRTFIKEVSRFTQTPLDFSAMLALSMLSVCWAGKVCTEVYPGYREQLMLYIVIAAASGERKSPVYALLSEPIREFIADAAKAAAPRAAELKADRDILEQEYRELTARPKAPKAPKKSDNAQPAPAPAAPEKAPSQDERRDRAVAIQKKLLELEQEQLAPMPIMDDATPEAVEMAMASAGGRGAILSPDGGVVFEHMAGTLRDRAANVTVFLKGYTGETHIPARVGRGISVIDRPALTIGIMTQPSTLRTLASRDDLRDRGLVARILFSCPAASRVGSLLPKMNAIQPEAIQNYRNLMRAMLDAPGPDDADPPAAPFAGDALPEYERYFTEIERRRGVGGDLAPMAEWVAKLRGNVMRIAALLHLADLYANGQEVQGPAATAVKADAVKRAVKLSDYLIRHAQAAFGLMAENENAVRARRLLSWIREGRRKTFTARDAQRFIARVGKREEVLDPALAILVSHGYVKKGPKDGKRELYLVSPHEVLTWRR